MDTGLVVKLLLIAKALIEIAGVALLGQGIVALFAGAGRETNPVYQFFKIITRPATWLARVLTPRKLVRDSHLPLVAFIILFWLWIAAMLGVAYTCSSAGLTITQCTGKSA